MTTKWYRQEIQRMLNRWSKLSAITNRSIADTVNHELVVLERYIKTLNEELQERFEEIQYRYSRLISYKIDNQNKG